MFKRKVLHEMDVNLGKGTLKAVKAASSPLPGNRRNFADR
jgi:hypothetical protein